MISVTTIASSSLGNCYYLEKDGSSLLLECGLTIKEIVKGTKYKLSDCDGVILTHEHKDHSLAAQDIIDRGLDLYASHGTLEAINCLDGHPVIADKSFKIKDWLIHPFETQHDAVEPLGYVINHGDDYLLFATDTYYIYKKFPNATQFLIECNYCEDVLEKNYENGIIDQSRYQRIFSSHFSLKNLKKYLSENYVFKNVNEIRLIHLSEANSDRDLMIKEIQELSGVPVYCE